ncbi:insulinase family protein [Deferribacter autotrophicus]|uniref:Insulinase family protein n=1 Tax=Deferribacter autotrophicus TaxID=500465 RepID=A0A5A8F4E4_9BACT|nr:pitrilysin family protein [Deferribacter autotrophicus]KAA0258817.1 insulinase family protein [Deferribacter autotrophicus]
MLKKINITILLIIFFASLSIAGGKIVTLKNGAVLIENKRDYNPTFSLVIMIKGGIFRENHENNGIGNLALNSWEKSSKLLKVVEDLGGAFNTSNLSDFSEISLSIPSKYLDEILPLLQEFLTNIKIDKDIFENEKRITLIKLKAIQDRPDELAIKSFMKATYGSFPYAMDTLGEIETVKKLTINDAENFIKNLLQAKNMVVSIAGFYSEKQKNILTDIISKLPKGEKFQIKCEKSNIENDKIVEKPHPNIKQAKLFMGYTAPDATNEDYVPVKILSEVLGGGMSSIYFNILRKEKGYAYSVGSFYPSKLCNSRFVNYIGLDYKNVKDALATFDEIGKNAEKYINNEKVDKAKNYLTGRILMEAQTNYKNAWYAAFFETLGLGGRFFDNYISSIENTSTEEVIKAAKKYLSGHKTVFILKGEN